ncbi:MAG: glycosyltransferase [Desulfarculus sp.]|nr:glycosyltransferase [Pseudomonadota bacterium]MBU4576983.1 glycosyltransferase [Pseudomonadota bacterium]MBU4598729.1 glycosyltransferase [Pseudomonadota bacterium]MBV1717432.1 glycosyltransferase [Desulfarculus sp.]MBV1740002.1 glycosyltransferase [Desulfarculus sp.]
MATFSVLSMKSLRVLTKAFSKTGTMLILAALIALGLGALHYGGDFLDELELLSYELEGSPWLSLARLSLAIAIFAMVWRIYLAITYRDMEPCPDQDLPEVTVVVPAYNEGAQVLGSLRSLAASDYPPEKLHLVAVDDGSRDDTWDWMCKAGQELGDRVELVRLASNQGKRHALYQGFALAKGSVLVTVDSDSEVLPDTLRQLVTPLVRDPQCGAVAGNVRVLNREKGIIPRMMEVSFVFSFDFIRAAQSRINTVMTTPGALAAYREDVVRPHLEGWLNQHFFGRPANIGEDRALTNLVLRCGYHALFARKAVVLTEVPLRYKGLCRMFLRWARSNLRETLVMTGFVFKHFRHTPALGARVNLLIHLFRMTAGEWLKLGAIGVILLSPQVMAVNLLLGALIGGSLPALVYVLRHRNVNFLWAFPYTLFWMLALSWISLWALLTPHKNGWLTRGLAQPPEPVALPAQACAVTVQGEVTLHQDNTL